MKSMLFLLIDVDDNPYPREFYAGGEGTIFDATIFFFTEYMSTTDVNYGMCSCKLLVLLFMNFI